MIVNGGQIFLRPDVFRRVLSFSPTWFSTSAPEICAPLAAALHLLLAESCLSEAAQPGGGAEGDDGQLGCVTEPQHDVPVLFENNMLPFDLEWMLVCIDAPVFSVSMGPSVIYSLSLF